MLPPGLEEFLPDEAGSEQPHPVLCIPGMWAGAVIFHGKSGPRDPVTRKRRQIVPSFIEPFLAAGYRCYVLTLPGYGKEVPVFYEGWVSFYTYLDAVRSAFDYIGRPIVIGHSLGGLLAQKLCEERDPPATVLLATAAPRWILAIRTKEAALFALRHLHRILSWLKLGPNPSYMNELIFNGSLSEREKRELYQVFIPASGRQALQIAGWGVPVNIDSGRPILVAVGGKDKITPPSLAEAVANKYRADRLLYKDMAHLLPIEPGWEQVASDVLAWIRLRSLPPRIGVSGAKART